MSKKLLAVLLSCVLICQAAHAAPSMGEWARPYYEKAAAIGIAPEGDLRRPITRAEVCDMAVGIYASKFTPQPPQQPYFLDTDNENVGIAYELGLVNGVEVTEQGSLFAPDSPVKRQELCKIFFLLTKLFREDLSMLTPAMLNQYPDHIQIADWAVEPVSVMLAEGIVTGMDDGTIAPLAYTSVEQAVAMAVRLCENLLSVTFPDTSTDGDGLDGTDGPSASGDGVIFPEKPAEDGLIDLDANRAYIQSFGEVTTQEEAEALQETITVNVWQLNSDGSKTPATLSLTVHRAIKDEVWAVFEEIFQGEEQFPIKSVGGYSWRAPMSSGRLSEHNWGTAIDINPDENYCIYADGTIVGKYWRPGEDPYSIPEDGEVVRIFREHGFTWGGNAWDTPKDFMHFSYMGR